MPNLLEQFSEKEPEDSKKESKFEVFFETEPKKQELEQKSPESPKEKERKIERLKKEIEETIAAEQPAEVRSEETKSREEIIAKYQDRYLPDYLREKGGIISRAITNFWTRRVEFEKEGEENIPEKGPFIVICNHFGGGDAEALLRTFKDADLHLAVAKEMWWNASPVQRWLLKKFGMIPIEESLSNLTDKEKEEALERQGKNGKTVFRKIIDREKQGRVATNIEFVRQAVAVLSRGDALGIFPEGL
jgi:hypothetical protein